MNPPQAPRRALLYPALFLTAFVFIFAAMNRAASVYDEGLILTGAMQIGAGEIPHRDFYTNYGPAQFYVVALLFKLFGPSVMVERLWDFAVKAAIATLGFAAVRTYCRTATALAAYAACIIWLAAAGSPGFPLFPAILSSLAATMLVATSEIQNRHRARIVAAGAFVGLTALFRYDVGGVVCAGLMLMLIVSAIRRRERFWRNPGSPPWLFALGVTTVFAPVAVAYMLAGGQLSAFFQDVIHGATYYAQTRRLSFPSLHVLWMAPSESAVYLPPVILALALVLTTGRRYGSPSAWVIGAFAALCIALYLKGWVRISVIHASGAIVLAVILLPMLWQRAAGRPPWRALVLICAALATVSTLFALKPLAVVAAGNSRFVADFILARNPTCGAPAYLRPVACILVSGPWAEAVRFIVDHVPKGERLLVGTARHDKIFANDNFIYFAAQRLPATHWAHYDPGLQTRADIQNAMVAELERQNVRYVVLLSDWDNVTEPNASALSSGVTILDDYIRLHYETVAQYGTISVLTRHE